MLRNNLQWSALPQASGKLSRVVGSHAQWISGNNRSPVFRGSDAFYDFILGKHYLRSISFVAFYHPSPGKICV